MANIEDFLQTMGHEEDRRSPVLGEPPDHLEQGVDLGLGQSGRGLVQHDETCAVLRPASVRAIAIAACELADSVEASAVGGMSSRPRRGAPPLSLFACVRHWI